MNLNQKKYFFTTLPFDSFFTHLVSDHCSPQDLLMTTAAVVVTDMNRIVSSSGKAVRYHQIPCRMLQNNCFSGVAFFLFVSNISSFFYFFFSLFLLYSSIYLFIFLGGQVQQGCISDWPSRRFGTA